MNAGCKLSRTSLSCTRRLEQLEKYLTCLSHPLERQDLREFTEVLSALTEIGRVMIDIRLALLAPGELEGLDGDWCSVNETIRTQIVAAAAALVLDAAESHGRTQEYPELEIFLERFGVRHS